MRKIVAGLFMSLDGVVESPDKWTGPYFSPDVGQTVGSLMAAQHTLLLGRVTYQGFADAFSDAEGDQVVLKLAASQALSNGVLHLTYQPA